MKLLPLPVNDVSDGRSIPFLSSANSTLHYHRIVVVVGILINRLSTVVTNKRQIVHFDGLKLWEIYVSLDPIIPTNHLEWWYTSSIVIGIMIIVGTEAPRTKLNWFKWREIRHFKGPCNAECTLCKPNCFQLRHIYCLFHHSTFTSQGERWCSTYEVVSSCIIIVSKTPLTNVKGLKRRKVEQHKRFRYDECIITQYHSLQLR